MGHCVAAAVSGHLEAFASGTGIVANALAALEAGEDAPELARMVAEIAPAPLTAVHVSRAADLGDPAAGVILERARRAVAVAVVSIVNVFGPDVVILGGGITLAWGERLIAPARKAVAESAFRIQGERARSRAGGPGRRRGAYRHGTSRRIGPAALDGRQGPSWRGRTVGGRHHIASGPGVAARDAG